MDEDRKLNTVGMPVFLHPGMQRNLVAVHNLKLEIEKTALFAEQLLDLVRNVLDPLLGGTLN